MGHGFVTFLGVLAFGGLYLLSRVIVQVRFSDKTCALSKYKLFSRGACVFGDL